MSVVEQLRLALGYEFQRPDLVAEALSHSSWAHEQGLRSNERLEFLGDSMLNAAATALIWDRFPSASEGSLTRLRAKIVSGSSLSTFAAARGIGDLLQVGKGEERQGGRARPRLLEDVMEALIGAIYLEAGFDEVRARITDWFGDKLSALDDEVEPQAERWKDPVTRLQEYAQAHWKLLPDYEEVERAGPAHQPCYGYQVSVRGHLLGEGRAPRKKVARRRAAEEALERLQRPLSIAVDGPASSGKGTVARGVAAALGYAWIDTGAMYRSVALVARRHGIAWDDPVRLGRAAQGLHLQLIPDAAGLRILVDGEDVTEAIRTPEIGKGASEVSRFGAVRDALLALQRRLGEQGGVVMDGRDIGTVVLPDADLKIYLDASLEARATRRHAEQLAKGAQQHLDEVREAIAARDAQDMGREVAPLRAAEDAVVLDTTDLTVEQAIHRVHELALSILDKRTLLP
ncbi:MAG: (d)CMP kinase [Deltaproteobacteria bacterium]|nr:(d)CMP kinase [Deltaproteobacteria bacterium]